MTDRSRPRWWKGAQELSWWVDERQPADLVAVADLSAGAVWLSDGAMTSQW